VDSPERATTKDEPTLKRRIEITVETKRVLLMTRGDAVGRGWCEACGREVPMLTPEEAGLVAGVSARAIYRRAEDGQVHFTETSDGALLVCSGSLDENGLTTLGDEE
jgi:hypothetical protein